MHHIRDDRADMPAQLDHVDNVVIGCNVRWAVREVVDSCMHMANHGGRGMQAGEWRQQQRLASCGLADPTPDLTDLPPHLTDPPSHPTAAPHAALGCSGTNQSCAKFPAAAIKQRCFGGGGGGGGNAWSLVVPAGWALPLWHHLMTVGAVAVGSREWQWIASDQVPTLEY